MLIVKPGQSELPDAGRENDAIQALQLAMEHIRAKLAARGEVPRWDSGEQGDTGFYRTVPIFFGMDLARKLETHIDREVERFAYGVAADDSHGDNKSVYDDASSSLVAKADTAASSRGCRWGGWRAPCSAA